MDYILVFSMAFKSQTHVSGRYYQSLYYAYPNLALKGGWLTFIKKTVPSSTFMNFSQNVVNVSTLQNHKITKKLR